MKGGRNHGSYTNPCLTMHQPWASLLVYGGCLWIHAAGKVPEEATIKAMENYYSEIYTVNGITDLKCPEYYPASRLLGCVEVVDCVTCKLGRATQRCEARGQTDFCWLCENP